MKVVILNYGLRCAETAIIPQEVVDSAEDYYDAIEDYLTNKLGYYLDEINYMVCDDDMVGVYDKDNDTDTCILI